MNNRGTLWGIVCGWLLLAGCSQADNGSQVDTSDFGWPDGQRAAVSLSYDDALESQLRHALPALDRHNLNASFYLTLSSPLVKAEMERWREAAAEGHELGNHTLFHPCSKRKPGREWVKPYQDLSKKTVEEMLLRLQTANAFLQALDGRDQRTLTPPCIDSSTADGNYLEAASGLFVAIKGFEKVPAGFVQMTLPDGWNAEQLIEYVEKTSRSAKLINIVFHGIGGDYMSVDAAEHAKFLKYLSENRKVYWTDTYLNIMKHVNASLTLK